MGRGDAFDRAIPQLLQNFASAVSSIPQLVQCTVSSLLFFDIDAAISIFDTNLRTAGSHLSRLTTPFRFITTVQSFEIRRYRRVACSRIDRKGRRSRQE